MVFESGVSLIYDGKVLEAVSEERFNFIKVFIGIPKMSLNYVLEKYNLKVEDIQSVVYSRVTFKNNWPKYILKVFKKLIISIFRNPLLIKVYIHRIKTELHDKIFMNEFSIG